MINQHDTNFINALNILVDCDLFKIVNKDNNYLYFTSKLTYKNKKYIACVSLNKLKLCEEKTDFFMLAMDELNNY